MLDGNLVTRDSLFIQALNVSSNRGRGACQTVVVQRRPD